MVKRVISGTHWGPFYPEMTDGRLSGVTPFELDPNPSPILNSIPDMADHPCRILRPAVRRGYLQSNGEEPHPRRGSEPFVEVSWDRALDLVANAIKRTRSESGNQAIYAGSYGWASAGKLHSANSLLHRFLNGVGGFTGSIGSYSLAAGEAILPHMVGSGGKNSAWETLVGTTQVHVSFGGIPLKNAQVTHGGMTRRTTRDWLLKMKASGCQFVNISPIEDDLMRELGAEWIAIRPNTDVALMLGMAHTLVSKNLHAAGFLAQYCHGFDQFLPYLLGHDDSQPKDIAWAEAISGVPADTIQQLAQQLVAQRSFLNAAWSIQRADHGEQPYWMMMVLACMIGQIGQPGGGFGYGYGSMGGVGEMGAAVRGPRLTAPTNPVDQAIPVSRIADMLLNPGGSYQFNGSNDTYPAIDMIYWAGGNPFHHHQDINRLIEAWNRPKTVVVNESFWTATARHADIVLPVATTLERNDIGWCAMDQAAYTMPKLIDAPAEVRLEWDLFADLAERMGDRDQWDQGLTSDQWLAQLYEQSRERAATNGNELPDFNTFWQQGYLPLPPLEGANPAYSEYIEDPINDPLPTPSGKFQIFSDTIHRFNYADCAGHPTWMEPTEWLGNAQPDQLHLISNQPATRLHSQLDFGRTSIDSKIADREPLRMHPDDAAARGLRDGDVARLFNDRGACLAGVITSDKILPGVVQLATGAWYDPQQPGQAGSLDVHGNPNMLTLDKGTSRLAQGPSAQTTLIEIEKWTGEVPPITVFTPPPMVDATD